MEYMVTQEGRPYLCKGSFAFCWKHLLQHYGDKTLAELDALGIKLQPATF